jgi:hypothetical protein
MQVTIETDHATDDHCSSEAQSNFGPAIATV